MLKVKAGHINNLTDARYFAAQGVDWMGLNLDSGSGDAISIAQFREIIDWVEGPKIIAEMGFCKQSDVKEVVDTLDIHALQIGQFGESPPNPAVHILREIVVEPSDNIAMLELKIETARQNESEHFLLNFYNNKLRWTDLGEKTTVNTGHLKSLAERHPIILSISFPPEAIDEISNIDPLGIELLGSVEVKPGFKSYDELDIIFEAVHKDK